MRKLAVGLAAAIVWASSAAAADFASAYKVEGSDPGGGGAYAGDVSVKRTSEATYEVVWKIGADTFTGTGIGGPEGLAIAYRSGSSIGVAIFSQEADGSVSGYWTYAGGKQIGQEKWTAK